MTDQDFMALNAEVERLKKLHEDSLSDPTLNDEQQALIAAEYTEQHRALQDEALRRVVEYKDA